MRETEYKINEIFTKRWSARALSGEKIEKNLELMSKIYGISILNYVIVIHRNNGLSIYQEQLGSVNLSADIISVFACNRTHAYLQ